MQLLVCLKAYREKFVEEHFCTTDDIFVLVQSGKFIYEIDGKSYTISANEGALFPKNTPGYKRVLEPVTMFLFRYKSDAPLFMCKKIEFEDTLRIQSTLKMLHQAEASLDLNTFDYKYSLFNDIVTQYRLQTKTQSDLRDEIITKAVKYIQEKYHSKLDLTAVAHRCNLSYPQFIRRFKTAMHLTPSDYVSSLRLNKAKTLLLSTTLQVREISALCGFESEYYFSKFFKKHIGLSPAMFRQTTV